MISAKSVRIFSIACSTIAFLTATAAAQCILNYSAYPLQVRYQLQDGSYHDAEVNLPLPTWGSVTLHQYFNQNMQPCDTGKTNCSGDSYEWAEFNINTGFSLVVSGPDNQVHQITIADVERWFDYSVSGGYLTRGWSKIGPMDFTKNCHGFTFGKDHWVEASQYGVIKVIHGSQGDCYPGTDDKLQAKYVVFDAISHSSKVSGTMCAVVEMYPGMWYYMPAIAERTEKNGYGPVYKKVIYCPGGGSDLLQSGPVTGSASMYKDP